MELEPEKLDPLDLLPLPLLELLLDPPEVLAVFWLIPVLPEPEASGVAFRDQTSRVILLRQSGGGFGRAGRTTTGCCPKRSRRCSTASGLAPAARFDSAVSAAAELRGQS